MSTTHIKPWIKKRLRRNATTLHEANFGKLARVVPCLAAMDVQDRVILNDGHRLELQVLEVSKYTLTFSLTLKQAMDQQWLPHLQMKIRNYYDAGVTEVLAFQQHYQLHARYDYPNPAMHQPNEKWQINQFLGEWLDHCLRSRHIFQETLEPSR